MTLVLAGGKLGRALPVVRAARRQVASCSAMEAKHSFNAGWESVGPYPALPAGFELKHMVVVHRHGDRAPISPVVGKVIRSLDHEDFWQARLPRAEEIAAWLSLHPVELPAGDEAMDAGEATLAQLTARGASELRNLGASLRRHLVDGAALLPAALDPSLLYARSTNSRRTQQSLQNVLLGLYPAEENSGAAPRMPLRVGPRSDPMLPNGDGRCARIPELIQQMKREGYVGYQLPDHEGMLDRASAVLGYPRDAMKWSEAREVLTCYEAHGLEMPEGVGITAELIDEIIAYTGWMWWKWFEHPEVGRLSIGRLLKEVQDMIGGALDGWDDRKLAIFAGHDSTIVPVLVALGLYDGSWPPYASYVAFEAAQGPQGEHLVRVVFNHEEQRLPSATGVWVPWRDFQERLRPWIPEDFASECKARGPGGAGLARAASEVASTLGGKSKEP